jgi:mannosyltransferase OCH1-like enzyme
MSNKIIFTFYHDKYTMSPKMKENWKNIVLENSEFECKLFDIIDAIEFFHENYNSDVLQTFMKLKPYSYKSDLFRYAYIYIHGGIYIDIKYSSMNNFHFHSLIQNNEYLIREPFGIQTCLLISKPNNKLYLYCINKIIQHVKKKWYGINALGITGPLLISYIYFNYFVKKYENNPYTQLYDIFEEESIEILENNKILLNPKPNYSPCIDSHLQLEWKTENNFQQIFYQNNLILQEYSEYRNDLKYQNNQEKHYMEQFREKDIYLL